MAPTAVGPEPPARPSTLGGAGWVPRAYTHEQEVAAGVVWARCGVRSEVSTLRSVLLARPPDSLAAVADAAGQLMLDRVDLAAMRDQYAAIVEAYTRNGVRVLQAEPPPDAPPNVVFMRDLFAMTPSGAVVGRTAAAQRAGEERYAAAALTAAGVPVVRTVTGTATFEGADALWFDSGTVVVGTGFRTNDAGLRVASQVLAEHGVTVVGVPLGAGVQHLLGTVVPIDRDLAAVHSHAAGAELRAVLTAHGYRLVEFEPDAELVTGRGMNFVTLAPRSILMPAGNPGMRRRLAAEGVAVQEVAIPDYLKAAGGLGCVTGIVHRAD